MRRQIAKVALLVLAVGAAACGTRVEGPDTSAAGSTATGTNRLTEPLDGSTAGQPNTVGASTPGGAAATGTSVVAGSGTTGSASASRAAAGSQTTGAPAPAGPATGEPIRLGAVGTQSGIIGAALEGGFRGLVVWQEWTNAHGGIGGRPVEITFIDDGADPGKHAAAIRRLILDENVVAFIGNIAPFTFSAGVPLLEQYGVPALGGEAADAAWFTSPLAFPINGQTISRSRPAAKWVIANLPERKAATFFVNEADATQRIAANFEDEWRKQGGQLVLSAGVSLAQPDFTAEVLRARNAGAEILYLVLEKSACNRWFDAQRRQQFKPIVLSVACTGDNARAARDLLTDRFYALSAARPIDNGSTPAKAEVLDAIRRFDPTLPPDGAFMFGWLAGKQLQAALAQRGAQPTPAGIIDALHRLPATGLGDLTPSQSWPPGPHAEGRCGLVSRFDGEKFQLLTPDFVC